MDGVAKYGVTREGGLVVACIFVVADGWMVVGAFFSNSEKLPLIQTPNTWSQRSHQDPVKSEDNTQQVKDGVISGVKS